jgi:hypothetical protein
MDKNYTDQNTVEEYLGEAIDRSISLEIENASRFIDRYTGRSFVACDTASARLFDGIGTSELLIDDCIAITKVEIGNDTFGNTFTEVPATGDDRYLQIPNNELPKTSLLLTQRYFPEGIQNIKITAKWGYSDEIPAEIKKVATYLVAMEYQKSANGFIGGIESERIGEYSVSFGSGQKDKEEFNNIKSILDGFVKNLI